MNHEITTIPEMLIAAHGNQSEVGRRLNCHRNTVNRYALDKDAKRHVIINGQLMVKQGQRGRHERN